MIHTGRTNTLSALRAALIATALAMPVVLIPPSVTSAEGPSVFINELHYDNDGSDVGEAVEIAGPAGTDLTNWSVVLYNGSSSQLNVYNTVDLSGIIPDQQAGFGTVDIAISGIQNGSPDGLALVDGTTVVEFLSYEGTFTPVNGPAAGTESTDIGVSETSSSNLGDSLQLTGTGTMGGDFVWAPSQANTFGAVNTGQTFSGEPPAPSVVINEVDYDQPSADTAEFVELVNNGAVSADLTGWTLELVNGSNNSAYDTIDLLGSLAPGDHYVVCANAATVANCDLDDGPDTNFLQNGAPDAAGLRNAAGELVDAVSYEGDTVGYTEGSGAGLQDSAATAGQGISRCDDGVDTDQNNVDFLSDRPITPGAPNDCDVEPPAPTIVKIHDIQGSGPTVAITGPVGVQGIVTSLFERDDALDAFFVQEEDVEADTDSATSEGIYVFCRGNCPAVAAGDLVTVTGDATEFFGMSQIDIGFGNGTAVIESSGNALPTPVPVDLPASGSTEAEATFENIEGMLVTFNDTLVVSEYFQLARFGQITLTESARPYQFTHLNAPSVEGYAEFLDDLATRRIILDDNSNDNNDAISDGPDEAYYYPEGGLSLGNKFRGGDTINDLTGVMHWSFPGSGDNTWRIRPIPQEFNYTFASANPEPASPDEVGGSIRVASFNVLNYFTTIDGGPDICGPGFSQDCRGADSEAELERQRSKIVAAMAELDADVLGLIELENDGDDSSVADLVAGLNAATEPGRYDYIATGFIGDDAIKQGFIYRTDTVSPVGAYETLDGSDDPRFIDSKNRPTLIQTFREDATSEVFTVAVNHLKSKGSSCNDDGQANCPGTRAAAAAALVDFLATDPTASGDPDFLIIGDLNSYALEDAITELRNGGYTDLLNFFVGELAYSYVFDGQLGYLDYALANDPLLSQVTGTTAWHINADEVPEFDYNDDIRDAGESSFERETTVGPLYAPDPFRSSDHDPVLVALRLDSIPDNPTCNGLAATIIGTPGDDVIVGTNMNDVIVTFGGNDTIDAGNGDDVICAGYGDDVVDGGNGQDLILGEQGDDTIAGGNGKDTLDGGDGTDEGDGGNGNDTCVDLEAATSCEL